MSTRKLREYLPLSEATQPIQEDKAPLAVFIPAAFVPLVLARAAQRGERVREYLLRLTLKDEWEQREGGDAA
ncbi:MAG TPA: hypothetical protein VFA10_14515 [Ktedonobacteraceae bacterium]|nr:hypothetical protein [Ktedonobacteraceae bacterium]